MSRVSAWVVCGPSMTNAYRLRYEAEQSGQSYDGPMDDRSYAMMSTMTDITVSQGFYKTKSVQGNNPFTLYGMNFLDEATCIDDLNYLDAEWPGNQIEIEGAWYWDTGLPVGQSYDEGVIVGDPVYPLNETTYELMPDDPETGDPATSNDDLTDLNVVFGQSPRLFQPAEVVVLRANGNFGSPALIECKGNWGAGRKVTLRIVVTNGGSEEFVFTFAPTRFLSALKASVLLSELIENSVLFNATLNLTTRVIKVTPEAPTHKFTITVLS